MAICREGTIVGPISGGVGGVVFAQTRYGCVLRKRGTTTDKSTSAQLDRRARFEQVVRAWSGLADEERAAWRAAAGSRTFPNRLGIERYLTGYQVFVWWHMSLITAAAIYPLPPGYMVRLPSATGLVLTASAAGAVEIDWVTAPPGPFVYTAYKGVRTMSVRPRRVFRGWRFLNWVIGPAGAQNRDITTEWDGVLGHPVEGEVVAVRVALMDLDYLISFWVDASTVTVA